MRSSVFRDNAPTTGSKLADRVHQTRGTDEHEAAVRDALAFMEEIAQGVVDLPSLAERIHTTRPDGVSPEVTKKLLKLTRALFTQAIDGQSDLGELRGVIDEVEATISTPGQDQSPSR